MDKEFYISAFNSISRTVWLLILTTIVIEGYLIQRAFQVNANLEEKIVNLDNTDTTVPLKLSQVIGAELIQQQTTSFGFRINYGTLTLLWPLILLSFFAAIKYCSQKRIAVIHALKDEFPDCKTSVLALDIFSFAFARKKELNVLLLLIFILMPVLGLIFHGYSGYYMIRLIRNAKGSLPKDGLSDPGLVLEPLLTLFGAQTVVAIIFLFMIVLINNMTLRSFRTADLLIS